MSDLICRKTMMRCQTPGMCTPYGGCQPQHNSDMQALLDKYDKTWRRAGMAEENVSQFAADNKRLREALQAIDRHNDSPARYDAHIDQIIKGALSSGKEVGV